MTSTIRKVGRHWRRAVPGCWYAVLVATITGSWWVRPGYVWLLDSVWGPRQPVHWTRPDTGIIWQVLIHALSGLIGAPATEKLILSGVLGAAGLGGYFLARRLMPRGWALAAGTLYLLNPYVYERLLGGQWIVVAGYAALPVALALASDVLETQGRRGAYRLAVMLGLYPFISPHFAYINVFVTALLVAMYVALRRPAWLWSRRTALWVIGLAVGAAAANWVWLASPAGHIYRAFTALDFATFRTAADPLVGLWGNVLGLYGFWHGSAFIEPKDLLGPVWLAIAAAVLACAVLGAVRACRARQPLALTLVAAAPVAVVLGVGYASPLVRPLVLGLIHWLPGFRGLRDSEKLVGVLALAYAILAPYGLSRLQQRWAPSRPAAIAAIAGLMMLAATSVTGFTAGAGGQVPVANYPAGWYRVAARLQADPHATAVVLPWHEYLRLTFAGNIYAAQPAAVFFTNPLLNSDEMDNILTARPDTPVDQLMLQATTGQISAGTWQTQLRSLGAKYIILEHTDDAANYAPLLIGLHPVYQDNSIALYQL